MFSAASKSVSSGGYQVSNSLRFRSSASAYLNRTPSVAGNRQTWTWSGWVKRGSRLGSTYDPVFAAGSSGSAYSALWFSNDTFVVFSYSGATSYWLVTTQVFRDPSAWYHIQVAVDTTQATSTDRIKLYVNGVQVTSFSTATYPSQNYLDYFDSTAPHYFGQYTPALGSTYFDGYMAEVNFIDGQALTPSSFGSINATTGVWQPARYTGSYGTNGFYLKFNNGTSTTTLGNDSSGNGNNWTTNNISLTAGSTYDWMLDVPTNWTSGDPIQARGNYCVMNPLATSGSTINANLSVNTVGYSLYGTTRATFGMSSGKWYWEITPTSFGDGGIIGISTASAALSASLGANAYGWGYLNGGSTYTNSSASSYGASYTTNDVIGVAFDADAGTLTFYKNNSSQGVAFSGLTSGPYFPTVSDNGGGSTGSVFAVTFGQRPFQFSPPSGFKSLCTQNLPAPAIYNGANHMAATLYTGTGATQSISNAVNGVSFQSGLVWTKARSAALAGLMYDSVRGATKYLQTNSTGAEGTGADSLTAFNVNGFSAGADTSTTGVNQNGTTYVGWQWKAGGTAVTNTSGTITSQVSANPTAGFSVVTFTAQSSGTGTVGHGLGVAPSMIITKSRNNVSGWPVYHVSLGNTGYLNLVTTGAFVVDSTVWNNTSPTSTVFQSGSVWTGLTQNVVAYCFAAIAGYSAFGSYTGNGSTDGPFVWTGFLPRFVMVKNSSAVGSWFIWDTSRNKYNVMNTTLLPNVSNSDLVDGTIQIDSLSNGFKLRGNYGAVNGSGNIIIYAAFASNPFQNSLAF